MQHAVLICTTQIASHMYDYIHRYCTSFFDKMQYGRLKSYAYMHVYNNGITCSFYVSLVIFAASS